MTRFAVAKIVNTYYGGTCFLPFKSCDNQSSTPILVVAPCTVAPMSRSYYMRSLVLTLCVWCMQSLLPSCVHKTHPELHLGNTLWHFWNMELVASNENRDEDSGTLPMPIAAWPCQCSSLVEQGGVGILWRLGCSAVMIMEERGHWLPTIQKSVTCFEPSNMVVRCNPSVRVAHSY